MEADSLFPIRIVAQQTGVNSVTLRAWERRYGLFKPHRTAKGHRLYSEQDIQRVRDILGWLQRGVSIGQVKSLLDTPDIESMVSLSSREQVIAELQELCCSLQLGRFNQKLDELGKEYPVEIFQHKILLPLFEKLRQLDRVDQPLILQAATNLVIQNLSAKISIDHPQTVLLASCGQCEALEPVLLRYALHERGIKCLDVGNLSPFLVNLSETRMQPDLTLVLLGSDLKAGWFRKHERHWPDNMTFVGQLGNIYANNGWLTRPFFSDLYALLQHENYAHLVQK